VNDGSDPYKREEGASEGTPTHAVTEGFYSSLVLGEDHGTAAPPEVSHIGGTEMGEVGGCVGRRRRLTSAGRNGTAVWKQTSPRRRVRRAGKALARPQHQPAQRSG